MKKNLHPNLHAINVTKTNQEKIVIYTTKSNLEDLKLEIDIHNHPAWVGKSDNSTDLFTEVVKFKNKFKNIEGI